MAMSRFIINNLTQTQKSPVKIHLCTTQLIRRFATATPTDHHEKPDAQQIPVSEPTDKPKLFSPKTRHHRSLWMENNAHHFPHALSGFGHAIIEAATNMNKLLERVVPSRLLRKFKEKDESYSIKYVMPGLSKDDVKITLEHGILFIQGEHKEEEEGDGTDDDEFWSISSYGSYKMSLMLPEDAKVDDITAEMKDGVLHIIVPKDETKKKHIKEVHVG